MLKRKFWNLTKNSWFVHDFKFKIGHFDLNFCRSLQSVAKISFGLMFNSDRSSTFSMTQRYLSVYYYGVSNFEFAAKTKKTPLLHLAFLINFFDFEFWTVGSTNFYSNFFDITFKSCSSILSKESFPNIALIFWKFKKMSVHGIF